MKIFVTAGLMGLLSLPACSSNTKVDDGSYRSIGQQQPRQRQNHNARQTLGTGLEVGSEVGASRIKQDDQIYVDAAGVAVDHMPEYSPASPYTPNASGSSSSSNHSNSHRNNQHLYRYGHPHSIEKIVQTARIHCHEVRYPINDKSGRFWGSNKGSVSQCQYQFPQHCGAHRFTVLSSGEKAILIYQPPEESHYVLDTLQGTPKSQQGLWDQDDHLGTYRDNSGYLFNDDYNYNYPDEERPAPADPVALGWIIKASLKTEEEYGKLYHKAVKDSTGCF